MDKASVLVIPSKIRLKKNYRLHSFTLLSKHANSTFLIAKIPQNTCLCETCENAVLLARDLNQAPKKSIPYDPHAIVEKYTCNSNKKDCMLSIFEECKSHGLEQNDFNKRNDETDENDGDSSSSSDRDGDDDAVCKYYQWKKGANGYLTKVRIDTEISESLTL